MSSSSEQAMFRLKKWVAAKSLIRASFTGTGLNFLTLGRLEFNEALDSLRLRDTAGTVVLAVSVAALLPCETFEPLIDAPAERKLEFDFFAAEAFRLPCGCLDLFEIPEPEGGDKGDEC